MMAKVCSDCGDEISEGFFSSADRCEECGRYVCGDCARETGKEIYCKKCFEDR